MRVLLLVPNSHNDIRDGLGYVTPPLGLSYIASYIRKFGNHSVRIFDGLLHKSSNADVRRELELFHPDVVGISGQATPSIYDVYHTARIVKQFDSSILVAVGGVHVTFQDVDVLQECSAIDVVIRGEGEITMNELLTAYKNRRDFANVLGITYRKNNTTTKTQDRPIIEDLDSLPYPAYDILNLPQYFKPNIRFTTMVTSRGCPYSCTFCSSSRITGKRWRGRSPENVICEVKLLEDKYGVREIEFIDDLFTFDHERVRAICKGFREAGLKIGWSCSTRANILSRHPEMAEWLHSAGCHTLYMGVESGSQRVLNAMKKGITIEQVNHAVEVAKKAGLELVLSFMVGYPTETELEANETIDLACRLDPEIAQFTVCTPYPGTPLYDQAKQEHWIQVRSWEDFSVLGAVMSFPGMTVETIKHLLHKAYLKFYFRPSYILKQIKSVNTDYVRLIFRLMKQHIRQLEL
ncbi:MAG: B12-binding domain-containing radical SAM protein [Candidatus Thorarchaeota archaeon]|nr:MAG: B12-binding domain-containing radical SAM protein [Candidatus Thorarchaeota archaeon]